MEASNVSRLYRATKDKTTDINPMISQPSTNDGHVFINCLGGTLDVDGN